MLGILMEELEEYYDDMRGGIDSDYPAYFNINSIARSEKDGLGRKSISLLHVCFPKGLASNV